MRPRADRAHDNDGFDGTGLSGTSQEPIPDTMEVPFGEGRYAMRGGPGPVSAPLYETVKSAILAGRLKPTGYRHRG